MRASMKPRVVMPLSRCSSEGMKYVCPVATPPGHATTCTHSAQPLIPAASQPPTRTDVSAACTSQLVIRRPGAYASAAAMSGSKKPAG